MGKMAGLDARGIKDLFSYNEGVNDGEERATKQFITMLTNAIDFAEKGVPAIYGLKILLHTLQNPEVDDE